MILQAASDLGLDLAGSAIIGDAMRDIEAGRLDTALFDRLTPPDLERLAVESPGLLHAASLPATLVIALNTALPPFDRLDARRAGVAP